MLIKINNINLIIQNNIMMLNPMNNIINNIMMQNQMKIYKK